VVAPALPVWIRGLREIARLAEATFERRYGGIRGLREIDFAVMARAPGAATRSRGEFLSFLLFDHEFTRALMQMGRREANRWLRRHPQFWCRDASHDLSLGRLE
jgi:NTE family protein